MLADMALKLQDGIQVRSALIHLAGTSKIFPLICASIADGGLALYVLLSMLVADILLATSSFHAGKHYCRWQLASLV